MKTLSGAYEAATTFFVDEFATDTAALRAFYGYLVNKVKLIRIKTDSIARALKIFETINDRGISLDAMDLLKNLLFMRANPSQFDKLKDRWKALTDKLYRAKEKPLRFLRYYLSATYGLVKLQEDELYEWLVKNEKAVGYTLNPLGFVDSLAEALNAYINFITGRGPDGREHPNVGALSLLAGKATRQHLVILLSARKLPDDIFSEVCRDTESLVFVYLVARVPSREFETSFPNWAVQIASVKSIDEYRTFSLKTFGGRRQELAERFQREFPLINGQDLKQFQLRYLVAKLTQYIDLEAYGQSSVGHLWLSRYCDSGANQIEHILAQKTTEVIRNEFGPRADDPHLVWSVGNLALAESAINQSLGNRTFSLKRAEYPKSQFLLTRAISVLPNIGNTAIDRAAAALVPFEMWNAQAVTQRAEMLMRIAQEVWDVSPVEGAVGQPGSPPPAEQERKEIKIGSSAQGKPRKNAEAFEGVSEHSGRLSEIEQPSAHANNLIFVVTPIMRHYAETGARDHFGFSGIRAAIACLYARPEGATQAEVNQAATSLGSPQKNYLNMLREVGPKWKHDIITWPDSARGGKVYKLIFNPSHSAPRANDPPLNWGEMNLAKTPPGVMPIPYL